MPTHECKDPRRTDGATLDVEYEIESYGSSATYDDPGDAPEILLGAACDITGADVMPDLTDDQVEALEAEIIGNADFDPGDLDDW